MRRGVGVAWRRDRGVLRGKSGVRAALFNDAGIGRDDAGVAGLAYLEPLGIAAAAVDHRSARIGDGADTLACGVVTRVNALAADCGVVAGMTAAEAAGRLRAAPGRVSPPAPMHESRSVFDDDGVAVCAIDSVVLALPEDAGHDHRVRLSRRPARRSSGDGPGRRRAHRDLQRRRHRQGRGRDVAAAGAAVARHRRRRRFRQPVPGSGRRARPGSTASSPPQTPPPPRSACGPGSQRGNYA